MRVELHLPLLPWRTPLLANAAVTTPSGSLCAPRSAPLRAAAALAAPRRDSATVLEARLKQCVKYEPVKERRFMAEMNPGGPLPASQPSDATDGRSVQTDRQTVGHRTALIYVPGTSHAPRLTRELHFCLARVPTPCVCCSMCVCVCGDAHSALESEFSPPCRRCGREDWPGTGTAQMAAPDQTVQERSWRVRRQPGLRQRADSSSCRLHCLHGARPAEPDSTGRGVSEKEEVSRGVNWWLAPSSLDACA